MKYEIVFESDRIYYIKLTEYLVNNYLDMVNDVEVQKNISHQRKTYTLEQELKWIKSKLEENATIFSMIEKETDKYIGNIEIMNLRKNIGEIGICITPKQQDKHFGQESIKALINYAFNTLQLEELELNVYNFNKRGINCYEKVGFIKDGVGKTEEDIHMIYKNR